MRIDPPDLTNERIQNIVSKAYAFDLPNILRSLRRIHGVNRSRVTDMTGISEKRLWALESGSYKLVRKGELESLASYYSVDLNVLQDCKQRYSVGRALC